MFKGLPDKELCFSSKTAYKFINAISDCHTGSIENQIIDVRFSVVNLENNPARTVISVPAGLFFP